MKDEEIAVEDDLRKVILSTENFNLVDETTDDEIKVLELQRAKRMKKKIVAKTNSNISVQPAEISNFSIFIFVLCLNYVNVF
jgi:hypothetical protein